MKKFRLYYYIGNSVETAIIQATSEQRAIETLRKIIGYVFVSEAKILPNKKRKSQNS